MANKKFTIMATALISFSIGLSGCSETTVSNTAANANANQAVVTNTTTVNTNTATNVPATNVNTSAAANTNTTAAPNANRKPAQAMKEPTPFVGSGGNDLLLFTQARTALSFDRDLQTSVIIDVKEGNVTLSGKASSAELKTKAEQAIKAVSGVKSVKNNITVSK